MTTRYFEITESPGQKATREQLERLYQRYHFASKFLTEGSVLEVACGSGLGLGYLAGYADRAVGGDIDRRNVEAAARHYDGRESITIQEMDAHNLPFEEGSFNTVVLFEAIYYLDKPEQFVSEAKRVLKVGGQLIVSTVNKNWKDFHPSKYAIQYFSVEELSTLLQSDNSHVEFYGGFEEGDNGLEGKVFSFLKGTASKIHIIPGSLKAREYLKRVFIGNLEPIPSEVHDGMASYVNPIVINNESSAAQYKIIYAVMRK